jgi:hypothetical protein
MDFDPTRYMWKSGEDLFDYRIDICFRQNINKYSAGRKFQDII